MNEDKLADDLNKGFEGTGKQHATYTTDNSNWGSVGNSSGSGNLISIELTEDLKKLAIVTKFIFDKKSKQLILSLNHEYKGKTIISPVLQHDWLKTTQKLKVQMTSKGVTEDHADIICDVLDYNYQKILGIGGDDNEADDEQQKRKLKM